MILVTGATGFIGRRLIQQLSRFYNKDEIICLVYNKCDSELEKTGREHIRKLDLSYIPVDLLSGAGLDKVPKTPKAVFHLSSITDTSIKDHSINDVGTKNLFESIKPIDHDTHFIFASSIAVNDNRLNYSVPVDEFSETPVRPCHEYGRKKLLTEQYLIQKSIEAGFRLSIVKVCGVYGSDTRKKGLFDRIEKMVLKRSVLSRINWPGKISLIHVDDMANFFIKVSQRITAPGQHEVYIPSVEALTLAEMSQIIYQAYGIDYNTIKLPSIFWNICSFFARHKSAIEPLLPHRLYNTFWQACILVNNEFWNTSKIIDKIFPSWVPIQFKDYYNNDLFKLTTSN